MLNKGKFNTIGFNTPGDMIKKLISFTIDALLKRYNLIKTIKTDLIIEIRKLGVLISTTSDLRIFSRKSKSVTCDVTIAQFRYVEKIHLRSYIKSVEDVYLNIDHITINRESKLDLSR